MITINFNQHTLKALFKIKYPTTICIIYWLDEKDGSWVNIAEEQVRCKRGKNQDKFDRTKGKRLALQKALNNLLNNGNQTQLVNGDWLNYPDKDPKKFNRLLREEFNQMLNGELIASRNEGDLALAKTLLKQADYAFTDSNIDLVVAGIQIGRSRK